MAGQFSGFNGRVSLTATLAPCPSVNDHRHSDSAIVPGESMPDGSDEVLPNPSAGDGSEDVPCNQSTRDSWADVANLRLVASAPTQPGHTSTPGASESAAAVSGPTPPSYIVAREESELDIAESAPAQSGHIDAPAAGRPPHTDSSDRRDVQTPTARHLNNLAAQDLTRTSQPDNPAALDPTRTSEPGAPATTAVASPSPQPSVPQLRNPARYHMLGEHGRGGIGKVSRAHDIELGRDVAIKELLSRSAMHEVRFMREALITARLEHPGIVPVHEAGRWPDGTPFYAMKLVAGRPLRDLLAERNTVDERLTLLHHVIAVADAIAYAHGRNIIHRDLKPGNVIVGDYGETVVIDWGLAKDLSSREESTTGAESLPISRDDDLTSAGAVIGTPAYMAPEQRRGEPVDRRADVYALGAMLWELCSLKKLSPSESVQRRRILRSTGIDPDLITIIDKALATDPGHRYRDAAHLAADLKAFKAGARIAARRYSLVALLAHWTRRHRALAVSVVTAVALASISGAVYVRRIAFERDRVRATNDALVLKQAQLLLRTDPTAAFELLSTYRGTDTTRYALLRAEAQGLGIAHLHVMPHTQNILFAQRFATDTFVTLGADEMVVKTSIQGVSRVIAQGVVARAIPGYTATRGWLAYVCDATAICIVDLHTEHMRPPPEFQKFTPFGLAFSPSGSLLAAISVRGDTAIWRNEELGPARLQFQAHFDRGESIEFIDDSTLIVQAHDGVYILRLDEVGGVVDTLNKIPVSDIGEFITSGELHLVVLGTTSGRLVIIDSISGQIVSQRLVCHDQAHRDAILPARTAIAYACENGDVGLWDITKNSETHLMHIDGGASAVAGSLDGRYIVSGGINGNVVVHDSNSGMAMSYLGHSSRIRILQAPAPDFPYILSGDVRGELRTWPVPEAPARVAIQTAGVMLRAVPLSDSVTVVAIGSFPTIVWSRGANNAGALPGHHPAHDRLAVATHQPRFAAYGFDDELELWSFDGSPHRRTITSRHGTIAGVVFAPNASRLTVACRDGSLEEWSSNGDEYRELGSIREPIAWLVALPGSSGVVAVAASGALWLSDHGRSRYLGTHPGTISSVTTSPDSRWLAVASSRGEVRLFDLRTSGFSIFTNPHPSTQHMAFTPDSAALAVATNESISLRSLPHMPADSSTGWSWSSVVLPATHLGFSRDGAWFAAVSDHGVWFHYRRQNLWKYFSTGTTKLTFGYFSTDSRRFIATDMGGRALVFDVNVNLVNIRVREQQQ